MRQYYSTNDKTIGQWHGAGAKMLDLSGDVNEDDFVSLCDNLNPRTGKFLTQLKRNGTRRIFYDLTIAPPKSVSIAALIGNDKAIVTAHDKAVLAAMKEFENYAATRVQINKSKHDRFTGNIIATTFRHDTSRSIDPQLHTHCLIFNATFDPVEEKWKALQNYEILKAQKYIDNIYQHILTTELKQLGYSIENNNHGSFEILGIDRSIINKFSKRHNAINKSVEQLIEERPELAGGNVKDMREIIAHAERPDKVKMNSTSLMEHWQNQLTESEQQALSRKYLTTFEDDENQNNKPVDLHAAIGWADRHLFSRRSVVEEHEVLRYALERIRGETFTIENLKECFKSKTHYLRNNQDYPRKITTQEALDTEWRMINLAQEGKWQYSSFHQTYPLEKTKLADDQKEAVHKILLSNSFITLFRGGAGVGKSFALAEVQNALHEADYHTITLAPQRQQVIDLEKDGLINANTVSGFLAKGEMPPDSVILLDEGGQLSARQMLKLFELAHASDARIICSGDTRQHGAVEASDAMRAIEKHAGIFPVSLNTIRRQDPSKAKSAEEKNFITEYRKAVKDASEGTTYMSFDRLDQLGAIIEVKDQDPANLLAQKYADKIQEGQTAVTVSQTWDEIQRVNEAIRTELKSRKIIKKKNHQITTLKPIDLTNAQKHDKRYHTEDTVILFNRNFGKFKKGEQATHLLSSDDRLVVHSEGKIAELLLKKLDYISLYKKQKIDLSIGDKIQIKTNGKSKNGKRLANGELVTIKSISKTGNLTLTDGRILDQTNRQFVRGYAITSYGSQGKTADHVFLCDSAIRAATNKQQWYVSISRARKGIHIYTRDKLQLRKNVYRLGEEKLALDLISDQQRQKLKKIRQQSHDFVMKNHIYQTIRRRITAAKITNQNPNKTTS